MNLNLVNSKEYKKLLPEIVQDGFLKPYKLKHLVLKTMEEKTGYAPSTIDGMTELFWAVVLDAKVDKLKVSKPKHELSKLPTSSFVDVFVEKKLKLKLSWNIATTIKVLTLKSAFGLSTNIVAKAYFFYYNLGFVQYFICYYTMQ